MHGEAGHSAVCTEAWEASGPGSGTQQPVSPSASQLLDHSHEDGGRPEGTSTLRQEDAGSLGVAVRTPHVP